MLREAKMTQMQILIVDDQTSVVEGLLCGMDWEFLGITKIFEAYNAFEAKNILKQFKIDIMLCDIEMPGESGLDLLNWIRKQNMPVECIFLTAHAEFDYARQALAMNSMEYMVWPVTYKEIGGAIKRAEEKIYEKRRKDNVFKYGKIISEADYRIFGKLFSDFVRKNITHKQYESYTQLGDVPELNQIGYLIGIQIFSWDKDLNECNQTFLEDILENAISEIFMPYDQKIVLFGVDENTYTFVSYGPNGYIMEEAAVKRQLHKVLRDFDNILCMKTAIYYKESEPVMVMPDTFFELCQAIHKNVTMMQGVFCIKNEKNFATPVDDREIAEKFQKWRVMVKDGMIDAVKQDITECLDYYSSVGRLDEQSLWDFYVEFNRMFYMIAEKFDLHLHHIFSGREDAKIYSMAYESLDSIKKYFYRALDYLKRLSPKDSVSTDPIELVKKYIHENIEKDIHREDITSKVHLNEDYLSRIFRKKMGMTLKEYIVMEKISVARKLIKTTELPVSLIALKVGYSNYSHFSKMYKKIIGVPPTEERRSE